MSELEKLKKEFLRFQSVEPRFRRYPKNLWDRVEEISGYYSHSTLARELGVGINSIKRRMGNAKKSDPLPNLNFIPLKEIQTQKNSTFEITFPNGIQIKLQL